MQVCLCHFWDGMHPLYASVFVRERCSHLRVSIIRLVHFWDMVHPLHCVFEWGKCAHCGGLDGVAHQWSSYFPTDFPNLFLCIQSVFGILIFFWFLLHFVFILDGLLTFPQIHLVTIFRITEWTFVFHVCSNLQSLFVSVAKFSGVCGSYQLPRSSLTWKWVHYSDKGACMHSCGANKKVGEINLSPISCSCLTSILRTYR